MYARHNELSLVICHLATLIIAVAIAIAVAISIAIAIAIVIAITSFLQSHTNQRSLSIMDRLLPDPYVPVPGKELSWKPDSIPIENKPGCTPINIMESFKYRSKVLAKADQSRLILPPDLYVPDWEQRNEIESK